ncbi:class IV adenylate cyclase [Candidatus Woesearchaeota archaeon]|nr:class IV adenylate cyclase [Candidatus Woesearchaeota archaeon]
MREIEVKILNIDVSVFREKLAGLGAKRVFVGRLRTAVFDSSDGRLKKHGEFLRVRQEGELVHLCFKGKVVESKFKVREEVELVVSDWSSAVEFLSALGFVKVFEYEKHRESYVLGGAKVELDTYEGIPTYAEVEAPSESEVEKVVKLLGFSMAQTTNISASELLKPTP